MKFFKWFDDSLILLINSKIKTNFLDRFMVVYTNLGGLLFISAFVLISIIFGNETFRFIGVQAGLTLFISQTITYIAKSILSRERPYNILKHLNTFEINLKDYSFPSGHSSASFSLAMVIAFNIPKLSVLVLIMALLVGISRIYIGVHYPTDVAAGIFLGMASAFVVNFYLLNIVNSLVEFIGS